MKTLNIPQSFCQLLKKNQLLFNFDSQWKWLDEIGCVGRCSPGQKADSTYRVSDVNLHIPIYTWKFLGRNQFNMQTKRTPGLSHLHTLTPLTLTVQWIFHDLFHCKWTETIERTSWLVNNDGSHASQPITVTDRCATSLYNVNVPIKHCFKILKKKEWHRWSVY